LRARIPSQIRTTPAKRERLLEVGLPIVRAIEGLDSIVTPGTFYHWWREAKKRKTT